MNWIVLAQDGDQLRVLMNTVMYFRVPKKNVGIFFSSCAGDAFSRLPAIHEVSYAV
jgi:hypothetical protein